MCDIRTLFSQEYGPVDQSAVSALTRGGAEAGAVGGFFTAGPLGAVAGAVFGGVGTYLESNNAAHGYINANGIRSSVDAALNIIYLDLMATELSPSQIASMGGLSSYEWAALYSSPYFQWFYSALSTLLIKNTLFNVLLSYVKSMSKSALFSECSFPR